MKEDFEKIYQKIILFAKLFNIQATIFEKNEENNFICFYNNNGELAGDIILMQLTFILIILVFLKVV